MSQSKIRNLVFNNAESDMIREILIEELKVAVGKLIIGRVAGHDGVTGEIIKYLNEERMRQLLELLSLVRIMNETPKYW